MNDSRSVYRVEEEHEEESEEGGSNVLGIPPLDQCNSRHIL